MTLLSIFASLYMITVSLIGTVASIFVIKVINERKLDGSFHFFCCIRAISNIICCLGFLLWAAPCTLLGFHYIDGRANSIIGIISSVFAYNLSVALQFTMCGNRFLAVFFPLDFKAQSSSWPKWICTVLLLLIVGISCIGRFQPGCGYVYVIKILSWAPEDFNSKCSQNLGQTVFIVVLCLTGSSFTMNLLCFLKVKQLNHIFGGNSSAEISITRKNTRLLVQTTVQDLLFIFDFICSMYVSEWYSELWFKFLCLSATWLNHIAIDSMVMYWCNRLKKSTRIGGTSSMILSR